MFEGDTIHISTATAFNAVSGSALFAGVTGEIIKTTDKAIQIASQTRNGKPVTAWFPKKALKALGDGHMIGNNKHHTAELAGWFKADGWTGKFLSICEDADVLSAG